MELKILCFLGWYIAGVRAHGILLRDAADEAASLVRPPAYLKTGVVHTSDELPESFTWRDVLDADSSSRRSLLTVGGNQHIPKYCGCCYAFGSMHTLQDRVKIARHFQGVDTGPDLIASVQVLLNCFGEAACSGGSVAGAWGWAHDFPGGGVPVEGCQRYIADDSATCEPAKVCENCMGTADWTEENRVYSCWAVPGDAPAIVPCFGDGQCRVNPYPRLGVKAWGKLPPNDPEALKREIGARGPVACSIDAGPLISWDGQGIVEDPPALAAAKATDKALNSKNLTDHSIEVVGWGVDDATGIPYWEFRNSWGEFWGDGGFGRIRRGRNDLLIETDCDWVTPSGWGVPATQWHGYSPYQVETGAAALMHATAAHQKSNSQVTAAEEEEAMVAEEGSELVDSSAREGAASSLLPWLKAFAGLATLALLYFAATGRGLLLLRKVTRGGGGGYARAPDVAAVELSPCAPQTCAGFSM